MTSFGDSVLLLRHGTDLPVLRSDLNQPLDPERLCEFEELVLDTTRLCLPKKKVRIIGSSRLRARQSVAILAEAIGADRLAEVRESDLIREVYHGCFRVIDHQDGDKYPPLVDAWTLWAEALAEMDIDYRYGNPVRNGETRFPLLVGIFTKFGESHREFTIRIYSFLADLINFHHSNNEVFNIVVAHQATLSRIQRVFRALSVLGGLPQAGELVRRIERSSGRIDIKESHGVVVRYPPRSLSVEVLRQEVDYLTA
ncbi:MAG: hypothetical protein U9M92_03495 [Patescibacteria group bacterium]|nr:hypothetical protein [Patescibacteria group bacterium]